MDLPTGLLLCTMKRLLSLARRAQTRRRRSATASTRVRRRPRTAHAAKDARDAPAEDASRSEGLDPTSPVTATPRHPVSLFGQQDTLFHVPQSRVSESDSLAGDSRGNLDTTTWVSCYIGDCLTLPKLALRATLGDLISWLHTYEYKLDILAAYDRYAPCVLFPSTSIPGQWCPGILEWGREQISSGQLDPLPPRTFELEHYVAPWIRYMLKHKLRRVPLEEFSDAVAGNDAFPFWDVDTSPDFITTPDGLRYHILAVDAYIDAIVELKGPPEEDISVFAAAAFEHQLARLLLLSIRPQSFRSVLESLVAKGACLGYLSRSEVREDLLENLLPLVRMARLGLLATHEAVPPARPPRTHARATSRASNQRTLSSGGPDRKRARSTPQCLICQTVDEMYPLSKLDIAHLYVDCPLARGKLSKADRAVLVKSPAEDARRYVVDTFLSVPANLQHASIKRGF